MKIKCGLRNITVTVRKHIKPLTARKNDDSTYTESINYTNSKNSTKRKLSAKCLKPKDIQTTKVDRSTAERIMVVPCMNLKVRHKSYFNKEIISQTCIPKNISSIAGENVSKVYVQAVKMFKKGWLEKCGGKMFNTWKPRYCILKNSVFTYYRQENDQNIKGILNLSFVHCRIEEFDKTFTYSYKTHRIFMEVNSKKKFTFRAKTSEECKAWINALKHSIPTELHPPPKFISEPKFWKVLTSPFTLVA